MRRRTLMLTLGVVTLLALGCAAGSARAWLGQGTELVLAGASDVSIMRKGLSGVHIRYRLPRGQTFNDVRRLLNVLGWRRVSGPNFDRTTLSFARAGWPQPIREILVLAVDPADHAVIDMDFARCLNWDTVRCF